MKKKTDTVRTFLADVSDLLNEENYKRIYERVPYFRREKADKLRFQEDRALSIGAWYLYMLAMEKTGATEGYPFNLSHSGKYALCSIGPKKEKVGCDVETIKDLRKNVARRFFCPEEYEYIMSREGEECTNLYYRYWVLKESFMKATRRGMALGMKTFEIRFTKEDRPYLHSQPDDIIEKYYFKEYSCENAKIAVCSTLDKFAESLEIVNF